jgi:hypothetical protein
VKAEALTLVAALLVLAFAVGCGGPPREVRVAIESTAGGLVVADELVADEVTRRGEEMRNQVRQERRDGAFDEGCSDVRENRELWVECIVQAADARFEELMEPTNVARRVLRTIAHRDEDTGRPTGALASLEAAADAWEAGTGDAVTFAQVAACVGVALADAVGALTGAEIEVPDLLQTGADLLRGFAAAVCSEGD